MCGRYNLGVQSATQLALALQAEIRPGDEALYRPRYNVAPTDVTWIVRLEEERRVLVPARWGFSSSTGRFLINARSETAATRTAFREGWRSARCLVPSTGFYEWKGPPKKRRPIWFHPPDGGLLLLAGLMERSPRRPGSGGDGPVHPQFVILTTDANELVSEVHERMPAILRPEQLGDWLAAPPTQALEPAPSEWLVATPVSSRLNSVSNDDPELLLPDPPEAEGKSGQLDLFGGSD